MAGARWVRKCSVFDGDEECDTVRPAGLTCHAGSRAPRGSIKARCRHRQHRVPGLSLHEPGPFLGLIRSAVRPRFWDRDNRGRSTPDLLFRWAISSLVEGTPPVGDGAPGAVLQGGGRIVASPIGRRWTRRCASAGSMECDARQMTRASALVSPRVSPRASGVRSTSGGPSSSKPRVGERAWSFFLAQAPWYQRTSIF
jgi:hypothetical protein